jgi:nucleoside-diphosphate-sugar epimerase
MKVVLTGATGFVGSEVLKQLLNVPAVTQVTCLARRPLSVQSPKIDTILHRDFAVYDAELARGLSSHDACIWALGGKASDNPNSIEFERATYTFTLAFANAVVANLARPFHFCYLSGMGADPSETSSFPWEKETRHLKGRTERDLEKLAQASELFQATSFRPAGILPASTSAFVNALLFPIAVKVDQLASAMIAAASTRQQSPYRVIHNGTIRSI